MAAGTSAAVCVPGDTAHCRSMPPLIITSTGSATPGTLTLTVSGFCLVVLDQPPEGRADVAVALAAARLLAAGAEHRIDPLAGARPCRHAAGERRREDAVDADRTDALWVEPHIGEGMVGPIGDPEDVPLLDAEREPQVLEVVGALDRVVGAEVDAERLQPMPALCGRLRECLPGFRRVERLVERLRREAVDLVTGEARLAPSRSRAAT